MYKKKLFQCIFELFPSLKSETTLFKSTAQIISVLMKMNPKQMEKMAKQLGMKMETVEAEQVVIKLQAGGEIEINNPQVSRINMMGKDTFQVTGDITEKDEDEDDEGDVEIVAEKAGVSHDEAKRVLDETNDIAEAILKLKEEHHK